MTLQPGYAFKSAWYAETGIPLLRGTNIEPGSTRWEDVVYLPKDRLPEFIDYELRAGDLVIAMDRPVISTGLKLAVLEESDVPALLLQRVGRFRLTGEIDSSYLRLFLLSPYFMWHVGVTQTGTQLPHISKSDIETAPIPVPPRVVQAEIAQRTEERLAHVKSARVHLARIPDLIDKFRQSVLAAAFRGDLTKEWREQNPDVEPASVLLERIRAERKARWIEAEAEKRRAGAEAKARQAGRPWTDEDDEKVLAKERVKAAKKYNEPEPVDAAGLPELPKGWCWASIGESCVVAGGKRLPKGHGYVEGVTQYPYLRVSDFGETTIEQESLKYLSAETHNEIRWYVIRHGDCYISIAGTIGLVGTVPLEFDGANLTENAARISPCRSITDEFLALSLRSQNARRQIFDKTISTTMSKLALFRIESIVVPIPPIAEQHAITAGVSRHRDLPAVAAGRVSAAYEQLARLQRSLLSSAFSPT